MSLIPWRNMFDGMLGQEVEQRPAPWIPPMDVQETEQAYLLRVELPGVAPEAVELTVEGNLLTLRGEKKDVRETEGKGYRRTESVFGAFERSVLLPEGVDAERITAEGANGVLTVRIGKVPAASAKRIQIKTS